MTTTAEWITRLWQGDEQISSWYPVSPADAASHAATRKDGSALDDVELAEWREWLVAHGAPAETLANLVRLGDSAARTVVTGQQAGLFGGPMFTLVKAAAAIRWARRVESRTGRPVVPVFWVASDDHDFAEVATVRWLGANGEVVSWSVPETAADHGKPVSARRIDPEDYQRFRFRFMGSTPPSEFRDALVEHLDEAAADATWESQFTRLLLRWLGSEGIVPVVPRLKWMRRRASALMRREIQESPATSRILIEQGDRLLALGVKNNVLHRAGNEANFFFERDGVRCKVVRNDEGAFSLLHPVSGNAIGAMTEAELLAALDADPCAFSPNVALRPLVQDFALPNIAYVGGPAEVLYHAQIGALYKHYDVFRPAIIPRPSIVAVEPRTERLAEKVGVGLDDAIIGGSETIRAAAARSADASDLRDRVAGHFETARRELEIALDITDQETGDTGLRAALDKMSKGFDTGCEKFDQRLEHWLARRDEETANQADRLVSALFPDGHIQERYLSALSPFFRVAGPSGPRRLLEQLDELQPSVQLVSIAPGEHFVNRLSEAKSTAQA